MDAITAHTKDGGLKDIVLDSVGEGCGLGGARVFGGIFLVLWV